MDANSSRRVFLKGSAIVGMAHIVGSRAYAASVQSSVIVAGAGAFGVSRCPTHAGCEEK
jgi:hypothetical protein